jgi:hypothetical protein
LETADITLADHQARCVPPPGGDARQAAFDNANVAAPTSRRSRSTTCAATSGGPWAQAADDAVARL